MVDIIGFSDSRVFGRRQVASLVALSVLLAGCGSGGGGSKDKSAPPRFSEKDVNTTAKAVSVEAKKLESLPESDVRTSVREGYAGQTATSNRNLTELSKYQKGSAEGLIANGSPYQTAFETTGSDFLAVVAYETEKPGGKIAKARVSIKDSKDRETASFTALPLQRFAVSKDGRVAVGHGADLQEAREIVRQIQAVFYSSEGRVLKSYSWPSVVYDWAVVSGEGLFVMSLPGKIEAFRLKDGSRTWEFETSNSEEPARLSAAPSGGRLVAWIEGSSATNKAYILDASGRPVNVMVFGDGKLSGEPVYVGNGAVASFLLTAGEGAAMTQEYRLYDVETGAPVRTVKR